MKDIPRLDILLYAHDGRGLGHASRSITIGLALRRLFPTLKVLFVTGCKISQDLIQPGLLDWIKLPSYETEVVAGISKGIKANSNFEDSDLGYLRAEHIRQLIATYRPRIILADHSPQGKHKELLPALEEGATDIQWILGVRGVPGNLLQKRTQLAASIFKKYYKTLLWYGDSNILGSDQKKDIEKQYDTSPMECGYVSRMSELIHLQKEEFNTESLAGTVSIPWIGENSAVFLFRLAAALKEIGPQYGYWKLFIESDHPRSLEIYKCFADLTFCSIERPSQHYNSALMASKSAIIYGGYNSLMDVLSLSLPSLVILRDMQDSEQQIHLQKLHNGSENTLTVLSEMSSEEQLVSAIKAVLTKKAKAVKTPQLNGAERAAIHLFDLLKSTEE